jgi:hypothetical protein
VFIPRVPPVTAHLAFRAHPFAATVTVRTLTVTPPWKDGNVGKHLLNETAEFKLPTLARHAADDQDDLGSTQRFDSGFQRPRPGLPSLRTEDAEAN